MGAGVTFVFPPKQSLVSLKINAVSFFNFIHYCFSKFINTLKNKFKETKNKQNAISAIVGAKGFASKWKNYSSTKRVVKSKSKLTIHIVCWWCMHLKKSQEEINGFYIHSLFTMVTEFSNVLWKYCCFSMCRYMYLCSQI